MKKIFALLMLISFPVFAYDERALELEQLQKLNSAIEDQNKFLETQQNELAYQILKREIENAKARKEQIEFEQLAKEEARLKAEKVKRDTVYKNGKPYIPNLFDWFFVMKS